jgi:hypothetical protein
MFFHGKWTANEAFEALMKEAYNPSSTDRKFNNAMKQVVKVGADVAIAAGTALAIPLAVVTLPALAALGVGAAIAGTVDLAAVVTEDHVKGFKDSKDLPKLKMNKQPLLDRSQINSILFYKQLLQLAGDRPGTRGPVYLNDVLEGMQTHYIAAKRNWKARAHPVNSCQDAENLFRVFAETDYHLSKMSAYAKALQAWANAYVVFCDRNAVNVQNAFGEAYAAIDRVLEKDENWHKQNCGVAEHCYRTRKLSRLLTSKVKPKAQAA